MKKFFFIFCFLTITFLSHAESKEDFRESARIELTLSIAKYYGLTRDQAIVLLSIYDHENTPANKMKTYGYFGIRKSDNEILSYCKKNETLYIVCCSLAAQTVKLHCRDASKKEIQNLGKGYPGYSGYAEDRNWPKSVYRITGRYYKILYEEGDN